MKRLAMLTLVVLLVSGVGPAWAGIANPGFESGDLTGWTVNTGGGNGSVGVVRSFSVWSPAGGNYFAVLRTDTGLRSNEVTMLGQIFQIPDAHKVSFRYFFRDRDDGRTAMAYASLINRGDGSVIPLLALTGGGDNTQGSRWRRFESDIVPEPGRYALKLSIRDGGARNNRALLGVDNFKLYCPPVIPEPMTMVAGVMGLAGVGGYIRKKRMR